MLKAMCAVLPAQVPMLAVGGVDAGNAATWWAAGAKGFGVGSTLWGPAMPNPNPNPNPKHGYRSRHCLPTLPGSPLEFPTRSGAHAR